MESTERTKVLETIRQKAESDNVFKQNLLSNPKKTIENFIGKALDLSENEVLEVSQLEDSSLLIKISNKDNCIDDVELSEEQLDIISGGGNPGAVIRNTDSSNG